MEEHAATRALASGCSEPVREHWICCTCTSGTSWGCTAYSPPKDPSRRASLRNAGIHEPYAREWLEHQAVARILEVRGGADAGTRRFALPPGHAEALLGAESLSLVTPLALGVVSIAQGAPAGARRLPHRSGRPLRGIEDAQIGDPGDQGSL